MQRILLFAVCLLTFSNLYSQGVSYTCTRTIELGCGTPCVTITASIPDLRSQASNYKLGDVTSVAACYPEVDPGGPGPSANLSIDDTYSNSIAIGFPFPFYGTVYNNLVVSTNGYVSFNTSLAGGFSHYDDEGNLPNDLYDEALIMGPYHDLNPATGTSPTQKVKYNTFGNAPTRKWVLSFYRLPLFNCTASIENTHQIILHESSGLIEVYIKDKQICTTWNDGHAMIGLQNFARNLGIMVPARRMSDAPWGTVGMNEIWRFVPRDGPSIFRGPSELVNLNTGAVVATSDTTRIDANNLGLSFANVCPDPNTTTTYVVRTRWQSITNAAATYFSTDTIIVTRQDGLPLDATSTQTLCGQSTGTITATASGGTPPYQYSIDLGPLQNSGTFTGLPLGNYTIVGIDAAGCSDTLTVPVTSLSDIPGTATSTATGCPGVNNGTITVNPGGGTAPYTYSLDGGAAQASNVFTDVSAGAHTAVFTDVNGCSGTVSISVTAGTALTSTSTVIGTSCAGVNNGQATITPTSGSGPYTYSIDGGPFQASSIFTGLSSGSHTVTIRDNFGCTGTRSIFISAGSGLIASVIPSPASCTGVNNGTINVNVLNGTAPYTYALDGGTPGTNSLFTGVAAGPHTVTIEDASGCITNINTNVTTGTGITGSGTAAPTACPGVDNGSITLTSGTGVAPFTYSIDGGTTFQASNIFNGLAPATYAAVIRDNNGCTFTTNLTVTAGTSITSTATSTATSCPGVNNGSITVTPTSGTAPHTYSIDGGTTFQASATFNGLASGAYTITIRDDSGCTGTIDETVDPGTAIGLTATSTPTACTSVSTGTITATATTGTAPYEYSLDGTTFQSSNIFNGLAEGPYTVTIRDANGCTGTTNVNVTANAPFTVSATTTPTACSGASTGSITATVTGGTAPFEYSLDGGTTYQPSSVFSNITDGAYTVTVRDASGCTSTANANVAAGSTYTGTVTTTPTACSGVSTGTITVTPTGGTAPYEYSINGGTTYQSSATFTNITDGAYTITIRDVNGCTGTVDATVGAGSTFTGTTVPTQTACTGVSTGSITVTPTGGTAPYEYSINGGTTYQPSNTFTALAEGAYTITIRDANGCTGTVDENITAGAALTGTASHTPSTCSTAPDGTLTVTPTSGTAPYTYSIDAVNFQASDLFNGLLPNTYTIVIRDAIGCTGTFDETVTAGAGLTGTGSSTATSCPGVSNGTITITPDAGLGLAPFTYSLDGGTAQASSTFTGVSAGNHTVIFTDANGCTGTVNIVVTEGAAITGSAAPVETSCTGVDNGSVVITPNTGTAPYTYALDGGTAQASPSFNNIAAGAHTVLMTDANGCTANINFNINTGAGFTASSSVTDATCPGVNNGSVTITTVDGTAPFTYAIDGGTAQNGSIFNGIAPGAHTVLVTDANGCTATVNFNVGAGVNLVATPTLVATSCPGVSNGSVEITPTTGTAPYQYTLDGGTAQASNTFTGLSAGPHTVTFTDAIGCSGVVDFTITDGPVITGSADQTATSCPGVDNGTITVTSNTGTAPFQYNLDGGAYQATPTFNGVSAGNHVTTIRDANGCITNNIAIVVGSGAPITGVADGTATTCPGVNDGTVFIASATGTAPYTYSLDGGASQASNTFAGLAPGTYTITFTDVNGCAGTAQATIGTGSGIASDVVPQNTSCPGVNNGIITVTPTSGNAPYQYAINGGTPQASNIFSNLAPGTYTIDISDALGCSGTNTATIEEGDDLNSTINPSNPQCADINDGIIEIIATTGTAPYTYLINGGSPQASNIFSGLAPGNYTISFIDAIGCTGTNTQALVTNPPITLTSAFTDPLCFGSDDGIITITASGGVAPYTYSINNGTTYQSANVFDGLIDGSYTIRVQDNVNCIKDIPVVLTQPGSLTAAAISTAPSTCQGGDGVIEITGNGGTAPYTYSIDNGVSYPFQSSPSFNVATGNYTQVTVKDDNGCTATAGAVFVDEIDNMFLELGADSTICEGSSVTFDPQTNAETSVFNWTPNIRLDDNTIKNATASPVDTTTYILTAQWGACSRIDSVKINVKWKPIPDAGPSEIRICLNDSTLISGTVSHTSGPVTLTWSPAEFVRDPNAATTMAVPNGTQLYTLTATDEYGCNFSETDTILVIMQPAVPAYAGGDTLLIVNQAQNLMGSGGVDYLWSTASPGVQIVNPTSQSPTVYLANDARFFVRVTDIAGCVGFDTVYVQVYQGPAYLVPNAFTPNGDGLNDVFRAIPVGMTTPEYFRIFNRYGQVVFETNQYMKGWDGRYKGQLQQTGTYIWILKGKDKNGRTIEEKGTVLLIN